MAQESISKLWGKVSQRLAIVCVAVAMFFTQGLPQTLLIVGAVLFIAAEVLEEWDTFDDQ